MRQIPSRRKQQVKRRHQNLLAPNTDADCAHGKDRGGRGDDERAAGSGQGPPGPPSPEPAVDMFYTGSVDDDGGR